MFSRVPRFTGWSEKKLTDNIFLCTRREKSPGDNAISLRFFCAKERENIIMEWITLLIAGMFEISWAIGLKFSHGFSRPIPSVITVVCMIASFYFLALALKSLPLGTAYGVWEGIGTLGTLNL